MRSGTRRESRDCLPHFWEIGEIASIAKITAAITLLRSAGYTVTPPAAPVGRPRKYDRDELIAAIRADPAASNRAIAERIGCHENTVAIVRRSMK